jgi:hypothetical protein
MSSVGVYAYFVHLLFLDLMGPTVHAFPSVLLSTQFSLNTLTSTASREILMVLLFFGLKKK